jgi:hypothetical protein
MGLTRGERHEDAIRPGAQCRLDPRSRLSRETHVEKRACNGPGAGSDRQASERCSQGAAGDEYRRWRKCEDRRLQNDATECAENRACDQPASRRAVGAITSARGQHADSVSREPRVHHRLDRAVGGRVISEDTRNNV